MFLCAEEVPRARTAQQVATAGVQGGGGGQGRGLLPRGGGGGGAAPAGGLRLSTVEEEVGEQGVWLGEEATGVTRRWGGESICSLDYYT